MGTYNFMKQTGSVIECNKRENPLTALYDNHLDIRRLSLHISQSSVLHIEYTGYI